MSIAAQAIESHVIDHFAERCADGLAMALAVSPSCPPDNWQRLSERGLQLAHTIRARRHDDIAPLLGRVTVADHSVVITVKAAAVAEALGLPHGPEDPGSVDFAANVRLRRSGAVLRLIVQARRYWTAMGAERITVGMLAAREGVTSSYATRVLRLAFLAPALVEGILAGKQPVCLTTVPMLDLCDEGNWEQQLLRAGAGSPRASAERLNR